MGAVVKASSYVLQTLQNAGMLADDRHGGSRTETGDFLSCHRPLVCAEMGTVGLVVFDLSYPNSRTEPLRAKVARVSSKVLLLIDLVDDAIDERPLTQQEKKNFLTSVQTAMFSGERTESEDPMESACYALANQVFNELIAFDKHSRMKSIFDDLVPAVLKQAESKDSREQLELAIRVGAGCADSAAVVTEIFTDTCFPHVRAAARHMGSYGQLLDQWHEVNQNLKEGSASYPTVRIWNEGNTRAVRESIKEVIMEAAARQYDFAVTKFPDGSPETKILEALKLLLDVRYRTRGFCDSLLSLFR